MADLQDVLNPVNNTGADQPQNSSDGNLQANPLTEQPGTLNQPQDVSGQVPTVSTTDLSNAQGITTAGAPVNEAPTNTIGTVIQNPSSLTDPQAAINAAKKEKLNQLIKTEQKKGEKAGFTKGILSGVAITVCIFAISVIFAKDQIVNLLSDSNNTSTNIEANVVDLASENNDEEPDVDDEDIDIDDEKLDVDNEEDDEDVDINDDVFDVDEDDDSEDVDINDDVFDVDEDDDSEDKDTNKNTKDSNSDTKITEKDNELLEKYYLKINDIFESDISDNEKLSILEQIHKEISSENIENEDLLEYLGQRVMEVYEKMYQEEEEDNWEESDNGYTITHVDSEKDANWVLPAHCDDLTCYGEDKEFSPCSTFKQDKNLNETARRIGNNGVCKYKDASELVYVKLK